VIPANCTPPANKLFPPSQSYPPSPPPKRIITNEEVYQAYREMGKMINDGGTKSCPIKFYGTNNGAHELCALEIQPGQQCRFLSFGISNDYTFDTALADQHNCMGVGLDPTQNYLSKIHNRVWFMAVGANSLLDNPSNWILSSVPLITKMMGWDHLDVLKMDCEGCEYALARDILNDDPDFLNRVDQVAFEFHVSQHWIRTEEAFLNLGKLLILLKEAELDLISVQLTTCSPSDEAPGCYPKLLELGYPCSFGRMCQNFLFAKKYLQEKK